LDLDFNIKVKPSNALTHQSHLEHNPGPIKLETTFVAEVVSLCYWNSSSPFYQITTKALSDFANFGA